MSAESRLGYDLSSTISPRAGLPLRRLFVVFVSWLRMEEAVSWFWSEMATEPYSKRAIESVSRIRSSVFFVAIMPSWSRRTDSSKESKAWLSSPLALWMSDLVRRAVARSR